MHIVISDDLAHRRQREEMEKAVRKGLLIRDYINAESSIGKFAELMQLNDEAARDWLHHHGIAVIILDDEKAFRRARGAHSETERKVVCDTSSIIKLQRGGVVDCLGSFSRPCWSTVRIRMKSELDA